MASWLSSFHNFCWFFRLIAHKTICILFLNYFQNLLHVKNYNKKFLYTYLQNIYVEKLLRIDIFFVHANRIMSSFQSYTFNLNIQSFSTQSLYVQSLHVRSLPTKYLHV